MKDRASKCVEAYHNINTDKFKKPDSTNNNTQSEKRTMSLSDDSDDDTSEDMDVRFVRKEIKEYKNIPDYWKSNSEKYPVIFELFNSHHFVPGSSTPSERKFFHCGEQVWDRRTQSVEK